MGPHGVDRSVSLPRWRRTAVACVRIAFTDTCVACVACALRRTSTWGTRSLRSGAMRQTWWTTARSLPSARTVRWVAMRAGMRHDGTGGRCRRVPAACTPHACTHRAQLRARRPADGSAVCVEEPALATARNTHAHTHAHTVCALCQWTTLAPRCTARLLQQTRARTQTHKHIHPQGKLTYRPRALFVDFSGSLGGVKFGAAAAAAAQAAITTWEGPSSVSVRGRFYSS